MTEDREGLKGILRWVRLIGVIGRFGSLCEKTVRQLVTITIREKTVKEKIEKKCISRGNLLP